MPAQSTLLSQKKLDEIGKMIMEFHRKRNAEEKWIEQIKLADEKIAALRIKKKKIRELMLAYKKNVAEQERKRKWKRSILMAELVASGDTFEHVGEKFGIANPEQPIRYLMHSQNSKLFLSLWSGKIGPTGMGTAELLRKHSSEFGIKKV